MRLYKVSLRSSAHLFIVVDDYYYVAENLIEVAIEAQRKHGENIWSIRPMSEPVEVLDNNAE